MGPDLGASGPAYKGSYMAVSDKQSRCFFSLVRAGSVVNGEEPEVWSPIYLTEIIIY